MSSILALTHILTDTLHLDEQKLQLQADTALLGSLPELDSMAVINVITAIEEHFGITVEDDEINGGTFATVGSLASFIDSKL